MGLPFYGYKANGTSGDLGDAVTNSEIFPKQIGRKYLSKFINCNTAISYNKTLELINL